MPHLVLADDSPAIQKVVELSFASEDVDVHCYADGHLTLEHLRSRPADVLLADVSLPGINGYQLCRTVREIPQTSRIPVVLLVGAFEQLDVKQAERVGYDLQLTKPLGTAQLVELVKELLERSSLHEAPATEPGVLRDRGDHPVHDQYSGQEEGVVFALTLSQCRALPPAFTRMLLHPEPEPKSKPVLEVSTVSEARFDREEMDLLVSRLLESLEPELRRLLPELVRDVIKRHQS